MKQKRHRWVGVFVTILLVVPFLLVGCPKRPEIAETTPKAIGPQGAIAMPGPALPPPPTVSAVPPTVLAPEEKSPPEVTTAQTQETEAAREGRVEEAEVAPGSPAVPEPGPGEAEVKPGTGVKEADVMSGASPSAADTEVKPETEAAPGSETQAQGAEVGAVPGIAAPSGAEPSPGGTSPSAPAEPVTAPPVAAAPVESPSGPAVAQAPKGLDVTVKDIFFDFDQAMIRDDSKKTMADNVLWLKTNPAAKVTIEGHCDERGSSEYNLALGERRARVTRDFLVAAGIEANRVNTISFGKERPFVLGHDESAWKWNRRAHFTLSTK